MDFFDFYQTKPDGRRSYFLPPSDAVTVKRLQRHAEALVPILLDMSPATGWEIPWYEDTENGSRVLTVGSTLVEVFPPNKTRRQHYFRVTNDSGLSVVGQEIPWDKAPSDEKVARQELPDLSRIAALYELAGFYITRGLDRHREDVAGPSI